ncbi:MAG: tRNA pseudouridine(38-40) synthase TruA [Planctomycetes bacterium]|nr:tRNA pseudouridine(38-40) synthase TruA [Planctomycetota bacterium]MBU1518762.1 tRNA pseudouridine(38-40) synthase TruA [Planctomycetota bacterium]MBU2596152.1 tRNA pseudouridine(38-40) synthase TruA [Planctomycetota bacterium]
MTQRNIKLTIQYDGSRYSGWQKQPGRKTIEAELVSAIENLICRDNVEVNGSSRTDAGVSALGQVANVRLDTPIPTDRLAKAISMYLPAQIVVTEAVDVPDEFDAIKYTKSKMYRYSIYTGKTRPVMQVHHCWHRPGKLDVEAMNQAGQKFVGEKNFKSFATACDKRLSSVRTIFLCDVTQEDQPVATRLHRGEWIYIDVEANGFLYNMVRNIVGTLVEIGRGRWQPEKIDEILEAQKRTAAGPIAPANGLCLMWIKY